MGVPGKPHASSLLILLPREDFDFSGIPEERRNVTGLQGWIFLPSEVIDLTFLASSFVGLDLDLTLTHTKQKLRSKVTRMRNMKFLLILTMYTQADFVL